MSGILAGRGANAADDRRGLSRSHSSNPDIAALQATLPTHSPAPPAPPVVGSPDSPVAVPNVAAAAATAASAIAAAVSAVAGRSSGREKADGDAAAPASEAGEGVTEGPSQPPAAAASAAAVAVASTVPRVPGLSVEEQSRRVLLCRERHEFLCSVEESPGMPWPRAKFQARGAVRPMPSLGAGPKVRPLFATQGRRLVSRTLQRKH